KCKAKVDQVDFHGYTALHSAVNREYLDIIGLLLFYGARSDIRNNFGRTAWDLAAIKSVEVKQVFRKYQHLQTAHKYLLKSFLSFSLLERLLSVVWF
ncbi:MAG: hypothetical protein HAW66_05445, partial [Shewanella sp.]|nr:hypothetical protein [Shewanella sp.]